MEDTNFNKFICYILNYINAPDNRVVYINHENKFMQRDYTNDGRGVFKSPVDYPSALDKSVNDARIDGALKIEIAAGAADAAAAANFKLITDLNNIKQYFNFKQLPKYILGDTNEKLNVSKCIFNTFNLIKTYFNAKIWYLQQYQNFTNSKSSSYYFNSKTTGPFYGGFDVKYDDTQEKISDKTYDQFLANVLKDIIYMVSDDTESIQSFDGITLFILSKINHYLAKRYAVLSLNKANGKLPEALKKYGEAGAYDTEFLEKFTFYDKNIEINNYPRYYQRELLKLFNKGKGINTTDDISSYQLVTTTEKLIPEITEDNISIIKYIEYYNYLIWYQPYFKNNTEYDTVYNAFKNNGNLNQVRQNLIYAITKNSISTLTEKKVKKIYDNINFATHFDEYDEPISNVIKTIISGILAAGAAGADAGAGAAAAGAGAAGTNAANAVNFDGIAVDDIKNAIKVAAGAAGGAVYNFKNAIAAGVAAGAGAGADAVAGADADAAGVKEAARKIIKDVNVTDAAHNAVVAASVAITAAAADAAARAAAGAAAAADAAVGAVAAGAAAGAGARANTNNYKAYATAFAAKIMTSDSVLEKILNSDMNKIDKKSIKTLIQNAINNSIIYKDENEIKKQINNTVVSITDIKAVLNNQIKSINDKYKKNHIAMLFKLIKSKTKNYTKNNSSNVYQSPTISYSVTPINIKPLVYKRATETDLSNYAAQIASDSFLHSNKLSAIPEIKTLKDTSSIIGPMMIGGSTNINNSSNVYRVIFDSILKKLNANNIKLDERDKEIVDQKLNELEEIEDYLKSTLSDYAKYASVSHPKGQIISYEEVHKFVTEYENKLREYNKNSAHMLKFIGKLTRYLVIK